MVALQGGGRRQDHVGVPRRLVDIDVDGRHEVETPHRPSERRAVRCGQHRVAGHGEQRPDLAVARRLDLLAEGGDRELAGSLGEAAHPAAPRVVVSPADQAATDAVDRRRCEKGAALPVEIPGDQVEQLDRPLCDRAVPRRRDAHSAIRGRTVGGRELPRDPADLVGRYAARPLRALGVEPGHGLPHGVEAVDVGPRACQALVEQHVQHGQQDVDVGAGTDEVVLGGHPRGLGAPRIEQHHPAVALLEGPQPVREVGDCHQGAVGRHRVGAEDQEVRGPVDIGDRQQQLVAVHQVRDQLVGELVHGGGAEEVAGAQGPDHGQAVGQRAEAVHRRVAQIDPDSIAAVLVERLGQTVGHQVERLIPADLHPVLAAPAYRAPQAVRVVEDVGQGHALGADVAT